MKINGISMKNWLGVESADVRAARGLTLLAGQNGAGKSAILDAALYAITGACGRIPAASHRKHLVLEGARSGRVECVVDGHVYRRNARTGKLLDGSEEPPDDQREFAGLFLQPWRFGQASERGRRLILRRTVGLGELPGDASELEKYVVGPLMKAAGDAELVQRLVDSVRAEGWDRALASVSSGLSDLRGQWTGITGEHYGKLKADNWRPEVLGAPDDAASTESLRAQEAVLVGQIERVEAAIKEVRASIASEFEPLRNAERETAARLRDDLEAAVQAIDCPECGAPLLLSRESGHRALISTERGESALSEINDKLAETVRRQKGLEAVIAKALRDRLASAAEPAADGTPQDPASLRARLSALRGQIAEAEAIERRRADADALLGRAKSVAGEISRMSDVEAMLKPDGIPGRLAALSLGALVSALGRMGSQLASVCIADDMSLTINGRPYGVASESQRWIADATISMALAEMSGAGAVALDRLDVIQPDNRGAVIAWLLASELQVFAACTMSRESAADVATAVPDAAVYWVDGDATEIYGRD